MSPKQISDKISSNATLLVVTTAVFTFFVPQTFAWVSGYVQTCILGFIMLTMGLTLSTADFRALAHRPFDLLLGTLAQYTIMPLVAFSLCKLLSLNTDIAIGIILVGCCPGGVSSNIMSYLCQGDVAYSVGMTTISTLLAPVVTPLLVLWLAGQSVDVDALGMFINILIVTLIPVMIGFFLNVWLGSKESFSKIQAVMPSFSVIALACIVGGVVTSVHDPLLAQGLNIFLITMLAVFCHNGLGYILGYLVAKIFRFNTAKRRTLSIEVGMQNAGLATNLATNFFLATNPLALLPCAISCAWHSISGTIMAGIFRRTTKL
ncbi:MAG: bile acid:sodium symporter family protein [Bacteroidaceae bacterium]|nr:bile acid:sodium symporter family protein [Bacteroidaceae bacterium]